MVHDTLGGGYDENAKSLCREKSSFPFFILVLFYRVPGFDYPASVDVSQQFCAELSILGIVNKFEGANVFMLLHDSQYVANSLGEGYDAVLFTGFFMDIDIR